MPNQDFSNKELAYLSDTDFLLTKKSLIGKICQKFKECSKSIDTEIDQGDYRFKNDHLHWSPKISKGENYRGLPYVVLDNPRFYTREEVLSYRLLFWWGNFISFSLHLEGPQTHEGIESLLMNRKKYRNKQIFFCLDESPWEYHFEETNYAPMDTISDKQIELHFQKNHFLKVAKKATLMEWPLLNDLAIRNLKTLTGLTNFGQQF